MLRLNVALDLVLLAAQVRSPRSSGEGHQPSIRQTICPPTKNDGNDAEAICTAARQPHIPFVPKKSVEQQDIQALHRARQRMVNHRTAVVSQIRGLLLDRDIAVTKSITCARRLIPDILTNLDNELTSCSAQSAPRLVRHVRAGSANADYLA
jgi:hypothetical protein